MEARVFDKKKLPSRHMTEGPEHAPHRSYEDLLALEQVACPSAGACGGQFTDATAGEISVRLDDATLAARKKDWKPRANGFTSGAIWKYAQGVGPARNGAVTHPGGAAEVVSYADI